MANLKFSGFTAAAAIDQTDSFLVGFDTDGGGANPTNNKWTFAQVAAGLAAVAATPYSIYAADGTIGTTRKALITDTIQFRNAGDTSDIFKLNTDGTFILGLGATNTAGDNSVIIGKSATDTAATNTYNTIIGASASVTGASNVANVVLGDSSLSTASGGVAIGSEAQANAVAAIAIGQRAKPTGANSVTLDATGTSVTAPNTSNAFSVYMSVNSTPDFRVHHDGSSYITGSGTFGIGKSNPLATLDVVHYDASRKLASFNNASATEVFSIENNGTVKIAGQAYTPPHVIVDDLTVDWNDSNIQTRTLASGANTFTPSNAQAGATYILKLTQPSSGTATISWESTATVNWPGGTAPTLSGTGKIDIVTLICTTGGATGGTFYANATLDFS